MEANVKPLIAVVAEDESMQAQIQQALGENYELRFFSNGVILYNDLKLQKEKYTFILSVSELDGLHGLQLKKTINSLGYADIPLFHELKQNLRLTVLEGRCVH